MPETSDYPVETVDELGEFAPAFLPQQGDTVQAVEAQEFQGTSFALSCEPGARFTVLRIDADGVRLDPHQNLADSYPGGEVRSFNGVVTASMEQVRQNMMRIARENE